jgi:uncharacterized membrane protein
VPASRGEPGRRAPTQIDVPSRTDRFVAGIAQAIGGPLGAHAVPEHVGGSGGRFWSAGRVVLAVTCLTLAVHWLQKSPCRQSSTWADYGQLSRFCYSDVMALYGAEGGLSQGGLPYLTYPLEYPVLTGFFMTIIGVPVHTLGNWLAANEFTWFYDLTALALAGCAVATVAMLLSLRRGRPWDALMFAAAPALLLTATVNWDLLAIGLAVGGMLAWARRRPELAGVLLGLGTAAKLWPGFLFLPLIFLALRTGRHRPVWTSVAVGVGTWLAVNLPVMLADYLRNGSLDNWGRFLHLNTERAIDWGTFWYVGQYLDRTLLSGGGPFQWLGANVDPQLNWLTYGLFGLALLGIGWLAVKAPQPPRVAALAFLTVAAFLLFNKVWSQQFVLWLLPLLVLARPRWGAFLAWQAAEVVYFFAFYGQLIRALPEDTRPEHLFVIPEGWFILAATLRWTTVAALCLLVVVDILDPREDPVRRSYRGDPDAGLLAGAGPPAGAGGSAGSDASPGSGGSGAAAEVENDRPVDVLPGDAGLRPGGGQRPLPGGTDHQVGQHDHRRDPE